MKTLLRAGALACLVAVPAAAQTHLVIVAGLSPEAQFTKRFHDWALTLRAAAESRLGIPAANIVFLADDSTLSGANGISTKDNVERALTRLASTTGADDQVAIVLVGDCTMQGDVTRFSVPGVDPTGDDFQRMLAQFKTQRVALVVLAAGSGDLVAPLSGHNRVIITATKTGFERNESFFGGYFVQALAVDGADTDKDGRVSLLEAYNFAHAETLRYYDQHKQLLTEHSQLDDNGDAQGSADPDGKADGSLAKLFILQRSVTVAGATSNDPRLTGLYKEKADLESQIESLKQMKASVSQEIYDAQLERLLTSLAEKTEQIRQIEAAPK